MACKSKFATFQVLLDGLTNCDENQKTFKASETEGWKKTPERIGLPTSGHITVNTEQISSVISQAFEGGCLIWVGWEKIAIEVWINC